MSHARVGDRLQLTAKVDPAARLKSFVLKPTSGNDYRLVLDLYPGEGSASVARAAPVQATPARPAPVVAPKYRNPTHSRRVADDQRAEERWVGREVRQGRSLWTPYN